MLQSQAMLRLAKGLLLVGALSLLFAAGRLYVRALAAGLAVWHLFWISPLAMLGGFGKARFVMRRRMRQNARRLAATTGRMWPWQIYPPPLLGFIVTMMVLMFVLKRVFAGHALALGLAGRAGSGNRRRAAGGLAGVSRRYGPRGAYRLTLRAGRGKSGQSVSIRSRRWVNFLAL